MLAQSGLNASAVIEGASALLRSGLELSANLKGRTASFTGVTASLVTFADATQQSTAAGGGTAAKITASSPAAGTVQKSANQMFGFAVSFTPSITGKVTVTMVGMLVAAGHVAYQLRFGVSTAPSNQGAVVGTAVGPTPSIGQETASMGIGLALIGYISNMVVGSAAWFDIATQGAPGGNANVTITPYFVIREEPV